MLSISIKISFVCLVYTEGYYRQGEQKAIPTADSLHLLSVLHLQGNIQCICFYNLPKKTHSELEICFR